ncbi:MAG: PP2C family protein-serine/threonine phosphatase [Saprospiraceae bacterium]|nr:PP2C family protein-serine/threonine phosphatase [Saprospiraceae bacterium]MCB0573116.1 PP2C family protein-serine/threonine phosphatase [Saprospiraceae bacterium]MCB9306943.1 PP2C family protein-serine/threonine phosphatase [Lewinellaceae bacterium]MCB9354273.1 PP2C family protein-serine/threonine phosphatase [Lewinellaceae bacterium]
MPELQEIKRTLSRIEKLEREVNLKQLQINSLLAITQAINENVSADGLFNMYNSFLRWEIGIRKMALFFKEAGKWECMSSSGIDPQLLEHDLDEEFIRFRSKQGLENNDHPLFREFDLVIPVMHKNEPIAFAFIGGFGDDDDVYNKVQFVTTITNVIAVAIENKRLFKQQLRQEVLNREVELAAEIQRTLVPSQLPSGEHYQLSSIYKPHFAVGGDYYDVVEFPDGKIAFCIADITGKGVSAALLMANFQANFHALVTRRPTLEEIVHEMNAAVHRVTHGDRFITLFLAKYDAADRTLHYINAGHAPPLLLHNSKVTPLKTGCTVLGWLPELPFLETGSIRLEEEALLFSYTDGLTDIRNKSGEDFSEDKLIAFLRENALAGAKELNLRLLAHIENFRERMPYPDDITVLTCKVF